MINIQTTKFGMVDRRRRYGVRGLGYGEKKKQGMGYEVDFND